jgi:hypothetical protein
MMSEKYENGQNPVFKVKMVVNIIAQDESKELLEEEINRMSLSAIEEQMEEGDLVGESHIMSVAKLDENEVEKALLDVGNDGEFFDYDEPFPKGQDVGDPQTRIQNAQMDQGWNAETMSQLKDSFIRDLGLQDDFARYIEAAAKEENELTASDDFGI